MGCGAMCQNSSSGVQLSIHSCEILRKLLPRIKVNNPILNAQLCKNLLKEIETNPQKYQLRYKQIIEPFQQVSFDVLQKWKILIYGSNTFEISYINCVGYKQQLQQIAQLNDFSKQHHAHKQYPHKSFGQIEKDLDRTFSELKPKRQQFHRILKRIANHFPKLGYTQGMNFIVGYLLIVGYSENDTFWLFVHLALNPKYMILGLYEINLPLPQVYMQIFRKVLQRQKPKLYNHLYQVLQISDWQWTFKWFSTYFLYSFPFQVCKYLWDFIISIGGIGMINLAVAITIILQKVILKSNDIHEITVLFANMKQHLKVFNQHIKMPNLIKIAYKIEIRFEDMQDLDKNFVNNKYASHIFHYYKQLHQHTKDSDKLRHNEQQIDIKCFHQMKQYNTKSRQILNQLYNQLIVQRNQFVINEENKKIASLCRPIIKKPIKQEIKLSNTSNKMNRGSRLPIRIKQQFKIPISIPEQHQHQQTKKQQQMNNEQKIIFYQNKLFSKVDRNNMIKQTSLKSSIKNQSLKSQTSNSRNSRNQSYDSENQIDVIVSIPKRKRITTHTQQWNINQNYSYVKSVAANNLKFDSSKVDSLQAEVQIFNGAQLFKKKNKMKIGSAVRVITCNNLEIQSATKENIINYLQNEQQSYESFFIANISQGHSSRISSHTLNEFQVESVK